MMTFKPSSLRRAFAFVSIPVGVFAVLVLFSGCKKEPPAAQQPAPQTKQADVHASQASADQPAVTTVATEQKTCPVMEGNPINKNIFVEYKGKKVYFCCKGCPEKFLANPDEYVAKLPQFQN
jgi:YHS domain-containing protein